MVGSDGRADSLADAEFAVYMDDMNEQDVASYLMLEGFINKSIELSDDREELLLNTDLSNFTQYRQNFMGVRIYIFKPLHSFMGLYQHEIQSY